jgi:hypothetical protein
LKTLFENTGVDLVFNGHVHCYERAIKNGITYLINGRGGADPLVNPCHHDADTEFYESTFGYVRLILDDGKIILKSFNQNGNLRETAEFTGI